MSGIIAQNSGRHTGLVKASSGGGGTWNLIKTYTASSDSDLSFVEGTDDIDFTAYDEFVFKFINIHPASISNFQVGFRDGSTDYDATKTTTFFYTLHDEADSTTTFAYSTGTDLAQSTGFNNIVFEVNTDNDSSVSGDLWLYEPSSTTYVKHFMTNSNSASDGDLSVNAYAAGYCNVTAAIDAVQFKMSTGNIDAGQISLYGIS